MSDMRISTGTTMQISEAVRDNMAAGIWCAMLAGAIFLTAQGQSILMTAGLMLELTAAYSTFVLCAKAERSPFVHAVPYAFALAGAFFLCLAPDFRNGIQASLVFLGVTVLMHGAIVYGAVKRSPGTAVEDTSETEVYASAA
jgi:hypothetical protein